MRGLNQSLLCVVLFLPASVQSTSLVSASTSKGDGETHRRLWWYTYHDRGDSGSRYSYDRYSDVDHSRQRYSYGDWWHSGKAYSSGSEDDSEWPEQTEEAPARAVESESAQSKTTSNETEPREEVKGEIEEPEEETNTEPETEPSEEPKEKIEEPTAEVKQKSQAERLDEIPQESKEQPLKELEKKIEEEHLHEVKKQVEEQIEELDEEETKTTIQAVSTETPGNTVLPKIWFTNEKEPMDSCSADEYTIVTNKMAEMLDKDFDELGYRTVSLMDRLANSYNRNLKKATSADNNRNLRGAPEEEDRELLGCLALCLHRSYLCNWLCPVKWYRGRELATSDSGSKGSWVRNLSSSISSYKKENFFTWLTTKNIEHLLRKICKNAITSEAVNFGLECQTAMLGAKCESEVMIAHSL